MTFQELKTIIGPYAIKLWPEFPRLSDEASQVWVQRLARASVAEVKQAMANVYARQTGAFKQCTIGEVCEALAERCVRRPTVVNPPVVISAEEMERIALERQQIEIEVRGTPREELEKYKAEILKHEPRQRALRNLPVTHWMWESLIHERYWQNSATIAVMNWQTRRAEEKRMSTKQYWEMLAKETPPTIPEKTAPLQKELLKVIDGGVK